MLINFVSKLPYMSTLQERIAELMAVTGLSVGQMAEISGVSSSAVSQWKDGPTKALKTGPATKLADRTGFHARWIADGDGPKLLGAPTPALSPAPSPGESTVTVPILANSGSMGGGIDALHDDVMVGALTLSENWVSKTVRPTRPGALRFIHGYGDSMSPTFEDGDVLLVDTGVRDPQAIDGVYVLAANNRLYIKRVRCRMDGAMEVSSDNATVKTVDVLNGGSALDVLGRVVWCWNGRKM